MDAAKWESFWFLLGLAWVMYCVGFWAFLYGADEFRNPKHEEASQCSDQSDPPLT